MELTQDQLRKVLYYNRATGDSHWRFGTKNRKPWRRAGTRTGAGYEVIRVGGKLHYEHRLAVLYTTGSHALEDAKFQVSHLFKIANRNKAPRA